MAAGGTRPKSGRPKKRKNVAIATVEAVNDLATTLKQFMDIGLDLLGREAPELFQLEIEMAKLDPHRTVKSVDKEGEEKNTQVYDKDIARLGQTSRQFLLKTLLDMNATTRGEARTMAEQALRDLIQIEVKGDLIIGPTDMEAAGGVLAEQAEGATVEGTARDIS